MEIFQHTIGQKVVLEGEGVLTGEDIRLELCPAPPNYGLVFVRTDLRPEREIPLRPETIEATEGSSVVGKGEEAIFFVEHLLAALNGLSIDNLIIRISGPEVPLFDGSARAFVEAILSVGRKPQWSLRRYLRVQEEIAVSDGVGRVVLRPAPDFRLRCEIDFPHPAIGRQQISLQLNQEKFLSELSFARTFGFLDDIIAKRKAGVFRGGSLENAIVLDEKGVLNPDGLRLPDEFVRHKALDLVGDFYLLGVPLLAEVEAYRSTHRLHLKALKTLLAREFAWSWYPSPGRVPVHPRYVPSFAV
ncbi:MAG: UDP-3-O-[3-hydroxymyristoyl] N-acetylglucosamine deacetylase [Thermodesulfobacteria bacterium]|nr:UDP-3-O-[3-hydroxymyristoyl] N-acetylglucosamine deacetylase [Thermodesulfobacteriota bacterium]